MTDWSRADINDILRELHDGKLSSFSIVDLQRMSARCFVYIQNGIADAFHAQTAINDEIRRKETAEFERRSVEASQVSNRRSTKMPNQPSTRVNIVIASPSDVQQVREAVPGVFDRWNENNHDAFLHPKMWEIVAVPELGDHPQHLITPRLLKDSDMLLAIFWCKLGTPTPTAPSGTVEEIREFILKKGAGRVMVYFWTQPVPINIDAAELMRLQEFKSEMRVKGVYFDFHTVQEFERDLYYHLDKQVTELLRGNLPEPEPDIPKKEERKETNPDPRMQQPVALGSSLKEISQGFAREMNKFDTIDGMGSHPNTKFYALGAHVYNSIAEALDKYLSTTGRTIQPHKREPIENASSRLKRLASYQPKSDEPFPKYWDDGRKICDDLTAHVAHLEGWKSK